MTTTTSESNGERRRRLEQIYVRIAREELVAEAAESRPEEPPVGFADLYRIVDQPDLPVPARVAEALARDATLRATLERLSRNLAWRRFPRLAAAATAGAAESREVEGCRITLRESQAAPGQTYVQIDLRGSGEVETTPTSMRLWSDGRLRATVALPAPVDGIIQLVEDTGSPVVAALRDRATEVHLG